MLCASGTCSAPTGAGAEKRWQNNNLCELGNRSGTGRKESAFNRRGPTRKPDNQLGFEMFADDCNCTGHLGVDAFCLALHGADLHIRGSSVIEGDSRRHHDREEDYGKHGYTKQEFDGEELVDIDEDEDEDDFTELDEALEDNDEE